MSSSLSVSCLPEQAHRQVTLGGTGGSFLCASAKPPEVQVSMNTSALHGSFASSALISWPQSFLPSAASTPQPSLASQKP